LSREKEGRKKAISTTTTESSAPAGLTLRRDPNPLLGLPTALRKISGHPLLEKRGNGGPDLSS